jgi:predicted phage tail protein
MITTIRLYGILGSRFGRQHRMDVSSASEAVRALCSQIRGFESFLAHSRDKGLAYTVFYGKRNIGKDELVLPSGNNEIRLAPVPLGAKNVGIFQIVLGAVLIAASIMVPGSGVGFMAAFQQGGFWGTMAMMGASMVMGGVAQMLMAPPKGLSSKDGPENTPNTHFNGPVNTSAQGMRVPVLHGRLRVGSAVVSAGISVTDDSYVPRSGTRRGDGGHDYTRHGEPQL